MIQEEKESTELRAEEIETRVTSGSMEALNLTQLRKRGSIPTSLTALSLASASPPLSGRSTPKLTSRSAAQDLDRMGVMTLVRVLGQLMNGPRQLWAPLWGLAEGCCEGLGGLTLPQLGLASSSQHVRPPTSPSGIGKGLSCLPQPSLLNKHGMLKKLTSCPYLSLSSRGSPDFFFQASIFSAVVFSPGLQCEALNPIFS